jgi:dipicolinate synthase subunit A
MCYILIAGGDMRQIMLSKMLEQRGFKVSITGFDKLVSDTGVKHIPDYIFLPIPYKNEDGSIKTPFSEHKLILADIVDEYPGSMYILGNCDDSAKSTFANKARYFDILQNEAFLIRNALLTAEGAICACMKNTESALSDTRCLVIGYGRIGKFLCRLLKAFTPEVTATARKDKDLELIIAEGFRAVNTENVKHALPEADLIFNTVPYHVLGEGELRSINKSSKIIELASAPYGMDMELAKKLGVSVQLEPGLPGRYFPDSAAKAMLHAFEGEELKKWN